MSGTPQTGGNGAGGRLLAQIREGMDVEDSAGEHVGKVTFIRLGDPNALEVDLGDGSTPGEEYAGGPQEPNVEPALIRRLLMIGYIKIDDARRLRRDHHYYAVADDVAAIDADIVRLNKPASGLMTPYA